MKRMLKLALAGVALIVILIIGGLVAAIVLLDRAAKAAIESGGGYALGVTTTVESVSVRPVRGEFALAGLEVDNPQGFATPFFVHLADARTAVATSTLLADRVEIPELSLTGVEMHLDRAGGKANYDVILENLKRFESDDPAAEPADGESRDVVIRRISIRDVEAHVQLAEAGGELTRMRVPIEEITLENVSLRGSNAQVYGELGSIVIQAIFAAILQHERDLPGDLVTDLDDGLDGLGSLDEHDFKAVGGAVESIGGTGGVLEDIAGSVGDLLGGGKKKGGG